MSVISDLPFTGHPLSNQDGSSGPKLLFPRIASLDVLRGMAVLCGLFISIWFFGGFSSNQQNGLLISSKGFDYRLYGAINLLFEGKMRGLIALVFGAVMLLILSKDNQKGELPAADVFIRRQLSLIFLGIVNALGFLWTRDVLFHLGIMGILLFPFVRLSARGLLVGAVIFTFIYSAKNYWSFADQKTMYSKYTSVINLEKKIKADSLGAAKKNTASLVKKDSLTKEQKADKAAWTGFLANMKFDRSRDSAEKKAIGAGSYGSIWSHQVQSAQSREAIWTYQVGIWDFGSMILLGMALFKFGFFTGRFSFRKYFLIAVTGITLGLLMGWFRLNENQVALHDYTKFIIAHSMPYNILYPLERVFMVLGYSATVVLLLQAGWLRWFWNSISRVGQMALTNYLLQSVAFGLFFTGFGMGYFGTLQQYQLYLLAVEMALVQIAFSIIWLKYYHYGPAEWLWRSVSSGKWVRNRKVTSLGPGSVIQTLS